MSRRERAEIRIDTTTCTPAEAAERVVAELRARGVLGSLHSAGSRSGLGAHARQGLFAPRYPQPALARLRPSRVMRAISAARPGLAEARMLASADSYSRRFAQRS